MGKAHLRVLDALTEDRSITALYADPENHEYTVRIEADLPTACTCPADAK
jgi:hypothetical protein